MLHRQRLCCARLVPLLLANPFPCTWYLPPILSLHKIISGRSFDKPSETHKHGNGASWTFVMAKIGFRLKGGRLVARGPLPSGGGDGRIAPSAPSGAIGNTRETLASMSNALGRFVPPAERGRLKCGVRNRGRGGSPCRSPRCFGAASACAPRLRLLHSAAMGLPYKIATLLYCFNERDEVLLLERAQEPNLGLWSPCGGKLRTEIGESPHTCACREAHEEAGLIIAPGDSPFDRHRCGVRITRGRAIG